MMKSLAAAAFLACPAAAHAQDAEVEIRLREWLASISGTLKGDGDTLSATSLDLESDLGIEDRELVHEPSISAEVPAIGRFTFSYWRVLFEGEETLAQAAVFDDRVFAAGTRVESDLRLDLYSLDYEYPVASPSLGGTASAEVGLVASARLITGDARLEGGGTSATSVMHRPLLFPGVHAGASITPWLQADAGLSGIRFQVPKLAADYVETHAEVILLPWRGLTLGLGYRYMLVSLESLGESTNFDLDATLEGFYLSAGWRF